MAGEHSPLIWTESDALAEVISAESGHIVLETCPPDYVEKISWYLGSHGGQSRQGEVPDEPAEAESDSGDSLFITQKSVPEPERSGRRRRRCSLWSQPTSPGDLEESDGDTSSSASLGEPITDREGRREKHALPKYSFPFLTERRWKPSSTLLPARQNISLHNSAMGGFFKCVREMWQGHQRGEDVQSSLPTVDMEGEYISPLSEEEGERSEDEDIKVVERKRFVAPLKAKSQQTWCNQLQQQTSRRAGQETSREPRKTLHATPLKATLSRVTLESAHAESSDEGDSSSRVLERERKDEHITGDGNLLARAETPMTKQPQQKAAEEELRDDSDAAVCEPHTPQRSPRQYTQVSRDAPATVTEPQTDVFHTDEPGSQNLLHSLPDLTSDTNDDSVCSWTGVKRKKKKKKAKGDHESAEEQKGQGPVEPEGQHAATSANVDETPSLCEDNRAEHPASQTCDELEFNEENWVENQEERDITESKPKKKKKKKKKKKLTAENVRQEEDGSFESDVRMEDSVFSASCDVETGGREEEKKKKKKKKKRKRSGEDVEQLQSSAVTEPPNDAAEIQKKKKKRKKEERVAITAEPEEEEASNRTSDLPPVSTGQVDESGNDLENHAASQETLETSYVKRKKHKKKQRSSSNDDAAEDGEEGVHVSLSNGAVTLAESSGMSLKKKKKKKKKTISEGVDISSTPEGNETVENIDDAQKTKEDLEDQNAELTKKRKEKKNKSEMSNRSISEDTVAQSDDSASVREKEKRRTSSFPVADAEENDVQTHREQSSPRSADAGVRKKRRKRKVSAAPDDVEKDHERDFEEPNKTCQSALPEATDAVVKRKKKRAGNESETVLESLESAADAEHSPSDEAAILKKKKKKKKCKDEPCHVIQESPPSKKGKQLDFPNGSTSDHAAKETLNTVEHASPSSETPGNQAAKDVREKKKKKKMESAENVLPEGKSLTKSEPQGNPKKERNKQSAVPNIMSSSPVLSETSLDVTKNKHRAVRRRLHNPSEDLLTDSV